MDTFITGADRDRIQAQLTPNEELLWCGKYETSLLESSCLAPAIMGIIFALAGTFFLLAPQEGSSAMESLLPGIFVLLGLALAILAPMLHIRHRRAWVYALTNKRAMLLLHNKNKFYNVAPYMVLRSRVPTQGLGKLVFEIETRGSGKNRTTIEWGFLRCRGLAEPLQLLENMLNGLALESSKSPEIRKKEREEELMKLAQTPYILPVICIITLGALSLVIGSGVHMLLCWLEIQEKHLHRSWLDEVGASLSLLLFGLMASFISGYVLYICLRGRKLLRERNSDTP